MKNIQASALTCIAPDLVQDRVEGALLLQRLRDIDPAALNAGGAGRLEQLRVQVQRCLRRECMSSSRRLTGGHAWNRLRAVHAAMFVLQILVAPVHIMNAG